MTQEMFNKNDLCMRIQKIPPVVARIDKDAYRNWSHLWAAAALIISKHTQVLIGVAYDTCGDICMCVLNGCDVMQKRILHNEIAPFHLLRGVVSDNQETKSLSGYRQVL